MRSFLIAFIAILVAMLPTRASGLLGQSLNTDALRVLGRVAFQPGLAVPHIAVPHVGHVDWSALHRAGVRAVVFDKGACSETLLVLTIVVLGTLIGGFH